MTSRKLIRVVAVLAATFALTLGLRLVLAHLR